MNRTTLMLAATMTLGSLTFSPGLFAADAPAVGSTAQQQRDSAQPASDVNAVRTLVGNSADAALRDNGFADLVGNFAAPPVNPANNPAKMAAPAPAGNQGQPPANDANSAKDANTATSAQTDKLNDQIRVFRQAFKTKYGEDFAIKDAQTLFSDINAANLDEAQAQPAAAEIKGNSADAQATPPPSVNTATPAANAGAQNAKSVIDAPEWVTLNVPEYQGAPAVTIHLAREGNAFKFASMHQLNQQTLATNLTDCLTKVNNDQSHWPADANTAERLVSQHVLGVVQKTQEADMNPAHVPGNAGDNNAMK